MEFGPSDKIFKLLSDCFTLYPEIEQVNVYGSRAMGNYRPGSDIDLAFYAQGDSRLAARLFTELDELPTPLLTTKNMQESQWNTLQKTMLTQCTRSITT